MHKIVFYSFLVISLSGFGIRKYWPRRMSWEVIPPLLFLGRICEKLENSVLNPFGPYDFFMGSFLATNPVSSCIISV